jgi:hypothetical protein
MKLTRENYEIFFLDYYEGNLSKSQEEELVVFLQHNSDLKAEFEAFEMISLPDEAPAEFAQKDLLRKPLITSINDQVNDIHLIAYHEGDLNEEEKQKVLEAIAGDEKLHHNFMLYGQSRLVTDNTIVYPGKRSLKHFTLGAYMNTFRQVAAAAAVIAFLSTLFFMLPDGNQPDHVAEIKPNFNVPAEELAPAVNDLPAAPSTTMVPEKPVIDSKEESTGKTERPSQTPVINQAVQPVKKPATIAPPATIIKNEIAQLNNIKNVSLMADIHPAEIEFRTEFYWVSYVGEPFIEEEDIDVPRQSTTPMYASLVGLAYNELERTTGFSLQNAEKQLAETRRYGLWDIAGLGLAGIGNLTGTPLTIERDRDDDGRVKSIGIGERFRITR